MNRMRKIGTGAIAAALVAAALVLASCSQNSDLTSAPTSSTEDVAATLMVSNHPIDQWEAEDNTMLPPPPADPGHHDMDSAKPGHERRPLPIPCLQLTAEQQAQVRVYLAELNSADSAAFASIQPQLDTLRQQERAAWEAYRQATATQREELAVLYRQFRAQVDSIRRLVRSGQLSKDSARAALRQLAQEFNAARKAIIDSTKDARQQLKATLDQIAQQRRALIASIQAQLDANYQQFLQNVASILTPEQLAIWQKWLNGENPCDDHHKPHGPRG